MTSVLLLCCLHLLRLHFHSSSILAAIISVSLFIATCVVAYFCMQYRNNKNDQMWQLNVDEIHFDDPAEVIGQGSFGVVLLAEYRGSKIAIKRAIKGGGNRGSTRGSKSRIGGSRGGSRGASIGRSKNGRIMRLSIGNTSSVGEESDDDTHSTHDIETADEPEEVSAGTESRGNSARSKSKGCSNLGNSEDYSLGFLGKSLGQPNKWTRFLPWAQKEDYQSRFKEAILGESASGMSSTGYVGVFCPCFDEHKRRQRDFIEEMRVLSRLRHPW
jgi:serine/threonine protein kinase